VNATEILFGKDCQTQFQIVQEFERLTLLPEDRLISHYSNTVQGKVFLVGYSITCADIYLFCKLHKVLVRE